MTEPDHYTASICARLCLRRHAHADSPEAAMDAAKASMTRAMRAAVDVAHAEACEVEITGDYLVTYPSQIAEPAPKNAIRPFLEDGE